MALRVAPKIDDETGATPLSANYSATIDQMVTQLANRPRKKEVEVIPQISADRRSNEQRLREGNAGMALAAPEPGLPNDPMVPWDFWPSGLGRKLLKHGLGAATGVAPAVVLNPGNELAQFAKKYFPGWYRHMAAETNPLRYFFWPATRKRIPNDIMGNQPLSDAAIKHLLQADPKEWAALTPQQQRILLDHIRHLDITMPPSGGLTTWFGKNESPTSAAEDLVMHPRHYVGQIIGDRDWKFLQELQMNPEAAMKRIRKAAQKDPLTDTEFDELYAALTVVPHEGGGHGVRILPGTEKYEIVEKTKGAFTKKKGNATPEKSEELLRFSGMPLLEKERFHPDGSVVRGFVKTGNRVNSAIETGRGNVRLDPYTRHWIKSTSAEPGSLRALLGEGYTGANIPNEALVQQSAVNQVGQAARTRGLLRPEYWEEIRQLANQRAERAMAANAEQEASAATPDAARIAKEELDELMNMVEDAYDVADYGGMIDPRKPNNPIDNNILDIIKNRKRPQE